MKKYDAEEIAKRHAMYDELLKHLDEERKRYPTENATYEFISEIISKSKAKDVPGGVFRASWEKVLGERIDTFLSDREACVTALEDPNERVRYVAMSMLFHFWEMRTELMPRLCDIAEHDPKQQIRCVAWSFLGMCLKEVPNPLFLGVLAKTVKDETRPNRERSAANDSLLMAMNQKARQIRTPETKRKMEEEFLDWIGWELVERCLTVAP